MRTKDSFQFSLATEMRRYISLKQALGRDFETPSLILLKPDQFLCELGKPSPDLTAKTFKEWCQTLESVGSNTRLARMRVVRNFCPYRRGMAPACFVPDPTQFPQAVRRYNRTFSWISRSRASPATAPVYPVPPDLPCAEPQRVWRLFSSTPPVFIGENCSG